MRRIDATLQEKMASIVTAMGYEYVGHEFTQENRRTIFRVYVDREGGVSLKDCSQISSQVGAVIDVDDLIQGKYILEVSSPGLDRPLFDLAQCQKQLGRRIRVRLYAPLTLESGQQRNFVGVLQRVEDGKIFILLEEGNEVELPFSEIEKANVVADINFRA